jgi:hypothetical protein
MFCFNDDQMIEFGRFMVYQSLKEMKDECENLNSINFEELAETSKRNIEIGTLREIIDDIQRDTSKDIQTKPVSPFGEFVN